MKLPPIAAIRAFEAAARHRSFTRAAEELGMTQAAVSYQIRLLEELVGTKLFVREPRQVRLTAAGQQLSPKVTEALDMLGGAFVDVAEKAELHLVLSVQPTVASAWLVPRLESFQVANPNIRIKLHTSNDVVDFAKDDVDAVIHSGNGGDWPGNDVFPLFPIEYSPVCTPEFRDRHGLATPADLLAVRRFGSPGWWQRWLREAGVEDQGGGDRMGLVLGVQTMDVAVTLLGQGAAMVVPTFFADELASGRLVRPFEHVVQDGRSYWLVYPTARRRSRKIKLFCNWAVAEAEATRSAFLRKAPAEAVHSLR